MSEAALAVADLGELAVIEKAREVRKLILAESHVDALKELRDGSQSLRDALDRRGFSLTAQNAWAENKLWAERRLGELLEPLRPGVKSNWSDHATNSLAEMGLNKSQSSRWQKISAIDESEFVTYVESTKATDGELTSAGLLSWIKSRELENLRDEHALLKNVEGGSAVVSQATALDFLRGLTPEGAALLLTDPPYSTDVDDVWAFARDWLPLALSRLRPTGRAYVCIGAYPSEIHAYLDAAVGMTGTRFKLVQILVWAYRNTLGPAPAADYKLNWQAILYFRGPDAANLNCPLMVEQFSVQDIAAPDGRRGDRYHAWQKPDDLAERFIRHSSAPGDVVIDPFAGTGTFLAAAARLGRVGLGCEVDADMLELCRARGIEVRDEG